MCVCVWPGNAHSPTCPAHSQVTQSNKGCLLYPAGLKTVLIPSVSHENSGAYTISGTYRICRLSLGPF